MILEFDPSFEKDLLKEKNAGVKLAILKSISSIEKASNVSEIPQIKKLKGFRNFYRIRIGAYRIGAEAIHGGLPFVVFGHRKDFYRYFRA